MATKIIDLSHPIGRSTPAWPGTPPVETSFLDRARHSTPHSRHVNSSRLSMNIHCGTHMDAPFHFLDEGRTIDQLPLQATHGWATLVDLPGKGPGTRINAEDLAPWKDALKSTGKAILRTGWSERWKQADFFTDYPQITPDAGEFLVACGVHLVGVEMGSVDYPPNETHVVLLQNSVVIVECLANLKKIEVDRFIFSAIPLKLEGLDGSPVRAIALVNE